MGGMEHSESAAAAVLEGDELESSEVEELESNAANSLAVNEDLVDKRSELGSEMGESINGAGAHDEEIGPSCNESETGVKGIDCCDEESGSGNVQTTCNETRIEAEGDSYCGDKYGSSNIQTN